ncbi:transmembrane protein, putative [Medicago truncatula]|uniref:Transmembrane protein, putative n=1 Tax=Medicago truncatula TaxID=3880 RepID=G7KZJ1_MEDTR|nr:transmembrane protein, putative [Medicago truncatula]
MFPATIPFPAASSSAADDVVRCFPLPFSKTTMFSTSHVSGEDADKSHLQLILYFIMASLFISSVLLSSHHHKRCPPYHHTHFRFDLPSFPVTTKTFYSIFKGLSLKNTRDGFFQGRERDKQERE